MSITINGTTGVSGVDGTAATPAVQGGDSNTGVFFPAADTVAVSTSGSERMRVDSSGNVGIGSTAPGAKLEIANATAPDFRLSVGGTLTTNFYASSGGTALYTVPALPLIFGTSNTERLRIASAGEIGIGGANYGTSGQVLTSGGSGAAPSWASRGFASATLTDKTGSRANGTTYQNTTNGWLFVSVRDSNNGQSFSVGPSSASLTIFNTNIAPGTAIGLVPPLYYYSISGSVLQSWYEGQA